MMIIPMVPITICDALMSADAEPASSLCCSSIRYVAGGRMPLARSQDAQLLFESFQQLGTADDERHSEVTRPQDLEGVDLPSTTQKLDGTELINDKKIAGRRTRQGP
jgi:hypothetical protein